MEKMILVFYVGITVGMSRPVRIKTLMNVKNQAHDMLKDEKDIIIFVVPSIGDESIKVECLNPKLMESTEYAAVKERLDKISKDV
jgi:hypothetical protein